MMLSNEEIAYKIHLLLQELTEISQKFYNDPNNIIVRYKINEEVIDTIDEIFKNYYKKPRVYVKFSGSEIEFELEHQYRVVYQESLPILKEKYPELFI